MRELYTEGVAIHGGLESCIGAREGVGEALAGVVRAGLLSLENQMKFGVPTPSKWRKAMPLAALSRAVGGPCAVGEPGHARKSPCARTGRSHDHPSGGWSGREGNAKAVIPR